MYRQTLSSLSTEYFVLIKYPIECVYICAYTRNSLTSIFHCIFFSIPIDIHIDFKFRITQPSLTVYNALQLQLEESFLIFLEINTQLSNIIFQQNEFTF